MILAATSLACQMGHAQEAAAGQGEQSLRDTIRQRWHDRRNASKTHELPNADRARIDAPGDYTLSLMHDGIKRGYRVHVPVGYAASDPTPLVLSLHGGGNMELQAENRYYGLIAKSEQSGYIVVFPN